jgi:abnormal spindle-like microcephaly-associated protein
LQGRELCYIIWEQRQAALLLQKQWRRVLASQHVRHLRVCQEGAVALQSFARRCHAVRYFNCMKRRVISVQRLVRGYLLRRSLVRQHDAACKIQQVWWLYVSKQDQEYASLMIQKMLRGVKARKNFREHRKQFRAASCIQKYWRAYYQWFSFLILAESTILLQRVFRGLLSRKATSFHRSQLAATAIQKIWRGFSEQVRFQIHFMDIICVQGVARRYLALNIRNKKIRAISVLQGAIRCAIARRKLSVARSALMIQVYWRSYRNRKKFLQSRFAIIHVQRLWRGHTLRVMVKRESFAATTIQKSWRRYWVYTDYKMFLKEIAAAVAIQAVFRYMLARNFFETLRFSAQRVQRWWKMYISTTRQREAALILQKNWRSCFRRNHFATLRARTVKIQSIIRILLAKNDLENRRWEKAAIALQRIWRGFSQQVVFQLEILDIVYAQSYVRRFLAKKDYSAKQWAVMVIQRSYRCSTARKHLVMRKLARVALVRFSVVTIQALFRSKAKRAVYNAVREAAIAIQKLWRGFAVKCAMWKLTVAASEIQRIWRRYSSRCGYLLLLLNVRSAVMIQAAFRMHKEMISLSRQQHAAVVIQCLFRCSLSRKCLSVRLESQRIREQWLQAALVLQSRTRGAVARRKLVTVQASAKVIQTWFRNRGRQRQLLDTIVTIQSVLRCCVQRQRYVLIRFLAIDTQRLIRGYRSRVTFARKRDASISIQSQWRCYVVQNKYLLDLLEVKSAVAIQATFRMYLQRVDYMVIKFAAHTIQRYSRGLLARVEVAVKHFAATEIQRIWRGCTTYYSFDAILRSIVLIQSFLRMARARQQVKELSILYWTNLCFHHRKAILIQRSFKRYQIRKQMHAAAESIQKKFRFYSQRKYIQLLTKGMTQFQSHFRGWRVRKARNKKMIRAAKRIQREWIRALKNPELRLGNRTDRALYILQTSQSLTRIMDAVKELEASTRLSFVCCQVFTKANAATILLHLIQSCNRSVPHMELKEHILLTLENVSRYSRLVGSFAHNKYAEVFLDNVQVFRDKDGIFCLAVSLLNRISIANPNVALYCSSHEHLKRLKEVYRVVSRRLNPRESHSLIDHTPRKNTLKKRVDFNRDYSIKVLGQMIEAFSLLETLPDTEESQRFRFDSSLQSNPLSKKYSRI